VDGQSRDNFNIKRKLIILMEIAIKFPLNLRVTRHSFLCSPVRDNLKSDGLSKSVTLRVVSAVSRDFEGYLV
jgi:hypothetical protein